MRNVWKGLVVGGLTGVVAGIVLDTIAGASKKALAVGDQVREHAPDAGRWLQSVTDKAGEWIHDADLPDHVRSMAERARESDATNQVKQASNGVVSAAKEAVAHRG
ncbi:MAG TPA: hypothetical protein VNC61_09455 [Acidimicrobiales bacterium]|nr:hypothetical protein [Acidimicrobiales bacterium]